MQKILYRREYFFAVMILSLLIIGGLLSVPISAKAQTTPGNQVVNENRQDTEEEPIITTDQRNETQQNRAVNQEAKQARLDAVKLKVCQKREVAITNIMARIADRGNKHLTVFDKIAERTKAFYEIENYELSNYQDLVNEVDAKRIIAEDAIDAIESISIDFECNGDNPKGIITSFKDSRLEAIAALKDYKTAVKNLIVAVKSVQSALTNSTDEVTEEVQQ
jgi:hypothetical protein